MSQNKVTMQVRPVSELVSIIDIQGARPVYSAVCASHRTEPRTDGGAHRLVRRAKRNERRRSATSDERRRRGRVLRG